MAAAHLSIPTAETLYVVWQIGWAVGGACLLWCSRAALRRETDGRIGWSAEPMAMIVFLVVYLLGYLLVLGGLAYELAKTATPLAPGVEGFPTAMRLFIHPALASILLLGLRKYAPEFSPQRPHRVKPVTEFGFTPMGLLRGFAGAMALVGAAALVSSGVLWLVKQAGFGDYAKSQEVVKFLANNTDWRVLLPFTLGAVIFAPINEELFYRGGVLAFLRNRVPRHFSYLLCGVIFSLMHMSVFAFLPLLVFGAWLAYLYDSTADIRVPVTVHACFNLSTVIWAVLAPGMVA
jgi:membrane protease YdiL (CAAX protease family)